MYNMGGLYPDQRLWKDNFTNFLFLSHNFGSRYARKPLNGCKDLDDTLDSKTTLGQKNGILGWRPGAGKVGKKNAKSPTGATSLTHNPKSKTKKLFFNLN